MEWITDWSGIGDKTDYIVCPINARPDGILYLGQPTGRMLGWQVKRLMERCYAALEAPIFLGLPERAV